MGGSQGGVAPGNAAMRRFQRAVLGAVMTLVLIVIERRVLKALRKKGEDGGAAGVTDGLSLSSPE